MRNPLTTEALAAWLEKQPADQCYDYHDNCGCALFQYFVQAGFRPCWLTGIYWTDDDDVDHFLPDGWDIVVLTKPHTFGAALARARTFAAMES